jgi:AcrR family transcriptional regulator
VDPLDADTDTETLPAVSPGGGRVVPGAAKARIVSAALDLFAKHGVGGTSLGMIAKSVGVTKAAVFHQFRTKDDIVLAAAEAELARLAAVLDAAEAQPTPELVRDAVVSGIVDRAVAGRRTIGPILSDPVVVGFFPSHEPFRDVMHRLSQLLAGTDPPAQTRVSTAMLTAAISGAVVHPLVADLDDDTLRDQVLELARRLLELPH